MSAWVPNILPVAVTPVGWCPIASKICSRRVGLPSRALPSPLSSLLFSTLGEPIASAALLYISDLLSCSLSVRWWFVTISTPEMVAKCSRNGCELWQDAAFSALALPPLAPTSARIFDKYPRALRSFRARLFRITPSSTINLPASTSALTSDLALRVEHRKRPARMRSLSGTGALCLWIAFTIRRYAASSSRDRLAVPKSQAAGSIL